MCRSMYLCLGHLQVVAKRKASPTHTIHWSVRLVQFNKLFRISFGDYCLKLKGTVYSQHKL